MTYRPTPAAQAVAGIEIHQPQPAERSSMKNRIRIA